MLLRSITKHVKDQNWYAIGIDFFIVVVGVYFGMQVAIKMKYERLITKKRSC